MPRSGGLYYASQAQPVAGLPVLVLIHGAGGSHANWPYQLRRLPGWNVLAPDLPGHGSTHADPRSHIADYAKSLWAWLDSLEISTAVLCGHSMGAAIALHMAHAEPQRVRGLLLLGAAARFQVNPQLLEKLHNPARLADGVRNIVQWSFGRATHPSLRAAYTRQLLRNPLGLLHADLKACADFDLTALAPRIATPAVVLCGDEDQMVAEPLSASLVRSLPTARQVMIARAGHMLMMERPEEVAAALEDALQNWK
ncbi:MAG: alpha/beta fold hydrolase [Anaerolineales bacterium]|nr:MAG: alpha/beta fold hydrolase [Anaerolineales bacterium]